MNAHFKLRVSLMKPFQMLLRKALVCLALIPATSQAITLSVNPVTQTVDPGTPVQVDLVIAGLGNHTAPSLGAFDLDLSFNAGVLAFTGLTFGGALGDELAGEAFVSFSTGAGTVNLFEVSLLEPSATGCIFCLAPYLEDLQTDSFVLATLDFTALGIGTSALGISINALSDGYGDALTADTQTGRVTVAAAATVPAPSTLLLMMAGLLGFCYRSRIAA